MTELASLSAKVYGRVQGVFFRAFVQEQAQKLGLVGYVKNLPGGRSVEVRAEGGGEKLEELTKQLRVGPPGSRVDEVIIEWAGYSGKFDRFRVTY